MASLYDEKVLGAKERLALARKLQEQGDNVAAGQMVSGWYVPNTGGAILGAVKNIIGGYKEGKAQEELDKAEQQKAAATMRAQESYGVPATEEMALAAGTPAKDPSIMSRLGAFVSLEDQPQATPAQPMAHNVAQNATPEQRRSAMISLMGVDPTQASNLLKLQELDAEQAKTAAAERYKGIPSGYEPIPGTNQMRPKDVVVGDKTIPYSDQQIAIAAAKNQAVGQNVSPVEQHSMSVQDKNLALAYANASRADTAAARAEARAVEEARKTAAKEAATQYALENPNAKKDLDAIQKATDTHEKLVDNLRNYQKVLNETPLVDRGNPRKNTRLNAAYQAATFAIRDPQLLNTGVMTGGDKEMLGDVLPDPTSLKGLLKGTEELTKGVDQVLGIANTNTSAVVNNRAPAPPPGAENAPIFKKIATYRPQPPAAGGALGGVSPVIAAPTRPPVQQQMPMQPPVQQQMPMQPPVQQRQKFTSSGW